MAIYTWEDDRAASMSYIAKSYLMKGERNQARDWYLRAAIQAPHLREPYVDLAYALYEEKKWEGVLYFTGCALEITHRPKSYICEADSWGSLPHDLRAMALEPDNERFQKNVEVLMRQIQEAKGIPGATPQ